jgi:hypothetical protein
MSGGRKLVVGASAVVALAAILAGMLLLRRHNRPMMLRGAVIRQDTDPKRELPIAEVDWGRQV